MRIRIRVELDSWDHARDLHDGLRLQSVFSSGRFIIRLNDLFLPRKYRYPLFMPASQYNSQKSQWEELAQRCQKEQCQLKFRDLPGDNLQVTLLGNELFSVGPMKICAEELVRGTTVNTWNQRFFDNTIVRKLTSDIQDMTGAFAQFDRRFRCVRLYGSAAAIDKAREQLQAYGEELSRTEYTRELSTQQAIRFFIEHVYPPLTETYGEDAVKLDLTSNPKKVIVTGDEEIRHRLNKLFDEGMNGGSSGGTTYDAGNDSQDCPICMCPVTAPTTLDCGHIYCTQCLTHLIKSSLESTSFPLTCPAEEGRCAAPISISLLEKFLHATMLRQLLETAFHAYLQQNPDGIFPCKTPGCTQLYARDADGKDGGPKTVRCPSCFVSACASCGKNAHPGASCEEARHDLSEEYIDSSDDIRRCPSCQTPIFKDGGCNHVSCRCGKHICWRCMQVFPKSDLCYQHMRDDHGGCFDADTITGTVPRDRRRLMFPAVPAAFIEEDARARRTLDGLDRLTARHRGRYVMRGTFFGGGRRGRAT
ncbi:hypothetical protein PHLGIDRAFT_110981 [Phlebiopsis gigantea 11061_1 CR5-6]|uniref:RING-type domain-containing protein n=1 Tax=Phlebiopsis gigantea (strain 11061_1 CR5-6) TaxID=745531 RepID=A0A0C3RSJ5_PHLG1|nr:hypothetical protein PHLGIDRAFT_110981 [Phlebiopsis gigantea 11061_1 CR5-6]